ncbi:MAG: hypothetical protein ABIH72_00635 [archaeon]
MNKKGWLRIFEAFIAVILIAGVLIVLVLNQRADRTFEDDIHNLERSILVEIADNPSLRNSTLKTDLAPILAVASPKIPPGMNFTMRVCPIDEICGLQEYREEVYVEEIVISSTIEEYAPKKLRIFIWEE